MRVILNPALIWVGSRLCVRDSTMSINSVKVGTGWISFQVVFILAGDEEKIACQSANRRCGEAVCAE